MPRPRRNPFTVLLGVAGVLFTITAANYSFAVLRGVKAARDGAAVGPHPLQQVMDRHGTAILVGELVVLAIATIGSVALDHAEGERIRRARQAEREGRGE